jgi:hypothetical protein
LASSGENLLNSAISQRSELSKFGLTAENLGTLLPELIKQTDQLKSNTADSAENQQIYADRSRALIDLQTKYNNEKEKQRAIEEESLKNLALELNFVENRIAKERDFNRNNAQQGKFDKVKGNLGNTLSTTLSFNSNDFYNQLSKDTADFGEQFKQTFKDGFAEAATGAKSFGDALTGIGISLGKNILTKASNLATDQLFGALFGQQSNLTGGAGILSGLFGSGTKKSSGGYINKYAKGGYVYQGSGVKDDVPALLSGGEFVVKKSSTQKIGKSVLDALNNNPSRLAYGGLIKKYASGGLSTKQLNKLKPQKQQDIINSISSQDLSASFANEYFGENSKTRPNKGSFNTSSLLSDIALTDENNPQNKLKFDRERYFVDLKAYEKQKRKALSQFNKAQTARRTSAYISAAINFGGSLLGSSGQTKPVTTSNPTTNVGKLGGFDFNGIQSYSSNYVANGGLIKKYGRGGSVFGGDDIRDTIPAMIMGGEFVVNKNAVNRIGKSNLDYMNKTGKVPGFANGGYVGDSGPTYGASNDIVSKYFNELISISAQIRDNINTKRTNDSTSNNSASGINISNTITVNIGDSGVKTSTNSQVNNTQDNNNNKDKNNQDKQAQGKVLGDTITKLINSELIKQSKSGGILYEQFKKK